VLHPHASGEVRGGSRATFRRGVSNPAEPFPFKHLIRDTQPGLPKFPAVVTC